MLAQNFKTANDLQITELVRDSLIKVLVLMETGKLKHVPDVPETDIPKFDNTRKFEGKFNMNNWGNVPYEGCGTVACIGGTAELVGGFQFNSNYSLYPRPADLFEVCANHSSSLPPDLFELFYPHNTPNWADITVKQAATALRSYLTTGKANWKEALK